MKPYKNRINLFVKILVLLFYTLPSSTKGEPFCKPPKYEVRAVWLTTIGGLDWPHSYARSETSIAKQKKELTDILDRLKAANFNTVLFQTRIRGTVIYPSLYEPWDGCCSGIPGKTPGYDPLQFAIDECHKRGMEIQAWIVVIPVGQWNGFGCKSLRNKYSKLIVKNGNEGFIDPSHPMAARYIANVCKEITEKYDIDGIHLDYIRYPETWRQRIPVPQARANITKIVNEVYCRVKSLKPWVKMSCSPIGKYDDLSRYSSRGWNAKTKGCQDAQLWLRLGIMDQLYPMMYFRNDNFYPFALDWKENSYGRTVIPGLGVYFLSPKEANWPIDYIKNEMLFLRNEGMGYAFFRNKFFCDDIKGLYTFTEKTFNLCPALVPPMVWQNNTPPIPPSNMKRTTTNGYETLTWKRGDERQNYKADGIMFNIYASKTFPVDINDPRNLIAVRIQDNHITLKKNVQLFYAVTSINRYGNESIALQSNYDNTKSKTNTYLKNDGLKMFLPEKSNAFDAEYILFKSQIGNIIAIRPYKGMYADISKINNGVYSVHSLNRKNITHRLGLVIIKR